MLMMDHVVYLTLLKNLVFKSAVYKTIKKFEEDQIIKMYQSLSDKGSLI